MLDKMTMTNGMTMANGMMMMGGEATPANLRKAKAIINEMLGENDKSKCCKDCCVKNKRLLQNVIGNYIADQMNDLLALAEDSGIDVDISDIIFNEEDCMLELN